MVAPRIPALLYVLSSVMFTAVNFARGYPLAGLVGLVFLATAAVIARLLPKREGTRARGHEVS